MRFRRPAPVVRLLCESRSKVRELRGELAEERLRTLSLEQRLGRALRARDQARRDAGLLAAMAVDKKAALGFVRDQHRIDQLPEGA